MKLELKHLAGYLPYGLKYKNNFFKDERITELTPFLLSFHSVDFSKIKPILRPLSDLTKEIDEDFNVYTTLSLRSKNDYDSGNPLILKWSHEDIQKLLEFHFDIYGLIEKGLAIDINTIK